MKKTLLELMVECELEWPDGANYATQDMFDLVVGFYVEKPTIESGDVNLSVDYGAIIINDSDHFLPVLAKDWHQSIVTREQYEAAKTNPVKVGGAFPDASESPNTLDTDKQTLDEKLSGYQWANNKLAKAVATVADWTNRIKELEDEIAAELASFGWRGEVKPPKPAVEPVGELNITDWRDLQVGDIIECLPDGCWYSSLAGKEAQVIGKKGLDYRGGMSILVRAGGRVDWGDKFKFIRRPIK